MAAIRLRTKYDSHRRQCRGTRFPTRSQSGSRVYSVNGALDLAHALTDFYNKIGTNYPCQHSRPHVCFGGQTFRNKTTDATGEIVTGFGCRPIATVRHTPGPASIVTGFGCRPIATVRHTPGPASESRQGTKARGVGTRLSWHYGDYMSGGTVKLHFWVFSPSAILLFDLRKPILSSLPSCLRSAARKVCHGRRYAPPSGACP